MSRASWHNKIAKRVDHAVEHGEPFFEVLVDGQKHVSLMTIDVTGDNTLIYLTRRKATALIAKLQRAVDRLPRRSKKT